jgi:hypothetical protein
MFEPATVEQFSALLLDVGNADTISALTGRHDHADEQRAICTPVALLLVVRSESANSPGGASACASKQKSYGYGDHMNDRLLWALSRVERTTAPGDSRGFDPPY